MNKNKRKSIKVKLAAVIAAVMMAMPFGAYAEEMTAAVECKSRELRCQLILEHG